MHLSILFSLLASDLYGDTLEEVRMIGLFVWNLGVTAMYLQVSLLKD